MTVFTTKESFTYKGSNYSIEYDGKHIHLKHIDSSGFPDNLLMEQSVWYKIIGAVDVVISEYKEVEKKIKHA